MAYRKKCAHGWVSIPTIDGKHKVKEVNDGRHKVKEVNNGEIQPKGNSRDLQKSSSCNERSRRNKCGD